jgi:hypothetical protein
LVRSIPRFSRCLNPDKMSNRIKYLFPDQLSKSEKRVSWCWLTIKMRPIKVFFVFITHRSLVKQSLIVSRFYHISFNNSIFCA